MRYFVFNFVARRCYQNRGVTTVSPMADEIGMLNTSFPAQAEILKQINERYSNLEDVTVTHKFEFKSNEDYQAYFGIIDRRKPGMGEPVIDTCDEGGHQFYYERGVEARCPHCLAIGLANARKELDEIVVILNPER